MRRRFPILLTLLGLAPGAGAQEQARTLSLDGALDLFHRNSPALAAARSRVHQAEAGSRQEAALPNPVASVTSEDLGAYSEQYFNLRQPMDFLWAMGARGARGDARRRAARARFRADSALLALEVKLRHIDTWQAREALGAHQRVDSTIASLLALANVRFAEGDLSGYDVRRLEVERSAAARRLASAENELRAAEAALGGLVSEDATPASGAAFVGAPPALPPGFSATARARAQRPELSVARATVEVWDAESALARRGVLEGAALSGGFKRQSDGQEGLFLGLEVPVPFLDRRTGAAEAARAGAEAAGSEATALERAVTREASLAATRLASAMTLAARLPDAGAGQSEGLLRIARVAWDEGEIGIVELLDAADAYLDSHLMNIGIRTDAWRAYFQLERAVGGLSDGNDRGDER
jgi:cobalt-zinc-cadmium efflux system outer membrane protein